MYNQKNAPTSEEPRSGVNEHNAIIGQTENVVKKKMTFSELLESTLIVPKEWKPIVIILTKNNRYALIRNVKHQIDTPMIIPREVTIDWENLNGVTRLMV